MNVNSLVQSPPQKQKAFNKLMETLEYMSTSWGDSEDSSAFEALSKDCKNHTNFTHWIDGWAVNYAVTAYKEYKEVTNV